MMRAIGLTAILLGAAGSVAAQRVAPARYEARSTAVMTPPRDALGRQVVHLGKWLTAAGTAALTVLGAEQHRYSRRDWDALLEICRSAATACTVGSDGRYSRADAELLYQRSRAYDRRANRWLLGAQASLLVTTALFIIDLHPGEGPGNIPFPGGDLTVTPLPDGAAVGMRVAF